MFSRRTTSQSLGPPAAVEALFAAVVDAGDARRGQLRRHHVEGQVAIAARRRRTAIWPSTCGTWSWSSTSVTTWSRYHRCLRPSGSSSMPVAEDGEVVDRVRLAGHHPLQLSGDVFDPQGRVQAGPLDHLPGEVARAGHFADQEEPLLPDALRELPDPVAERAKRIGVHVLGGVDAKAVEVGVGDPEAIGEAQPRHGRRRAGGTARPSAPGRPAS